MTTRSPPLSVVLAPAAAPPTPSIVRRGRIRVDRQGNSANAYIVGLPTTNDVACYTSASVSDACVFELDDRRRTITFQARSMTIFDFLLLLIYQ